MSNSHSSYQSLIDNLSREDRQKVQEDLAKRLETGGVDSETWFELRGLFLALAKGEEHGKALRNQERILDAPSD